MRVALAIDYGLFPCLGWSSDMLFAYPLVLNLIYLTSTGRCISWDRLHLKLNSRVFEMTEVCEIEGPN